MTALQEKRTRPWMVKVVVILMLLCAASVLANAIRWNVDYDCGPEPEPECPGWGSVVDLLLLIAGVAALAFVALAVAIWRGRQWAWFPTMGMCVVAIWLFTPWNFAWGDGLVLGWGLVAEALVLAVTVFLVLPPVFRWCWPKLDLGDSER